MLIEISFIRDGLAIEEKIAEKKLEIEIKSLQWKQVQIFVWKPMKPKWWIKNEQQCWTSKLQITQIDICRWFATVKHKLTLNWITTYFHFINLTLEIWLDLNRYRHCHYNFILFLSLSVALLQFVLSLYAKCAFMRWMRPHYYIIASYKII